MRPYVSVGADFDGTATPAGCYRRADIDGVDLVLLNQAPIELAYHVITDGERVYETDRATRVEYEAFVLGRYGDFRAHREQVLSDHSR